MATARQVLEIAKGEVGYVEKPTNLTKYGQWYGLDGQPWCAMFVSWVLYNKAGFDDPRIKGSNEFKHAYTPAGAAVFQGIDGWVMKPRMGDLGFMDFPGDGINRISHIGIVERVMPNGDVICIEGNTSSGNVGSQRNGGGVYRRVRPRSVFVGFGRPRYEKADALDDKMLALGDKGPAVRTWQRQLNFIAGARLRDDGEFKKMTHNATVRFQRKNGLTPDGTAGPKTLRVMKRLYEGKMLAWLYDRKDVREFLPAKNDARF